MDVDKYKVLLVKIRFCSTASQRHCDLLNRKEKRKQSIAISRSVVTTTKASVFAPKGRVLTCFVISSNLALLFPFLFQCTP